MPTPMNRPPTAIGLSASSVRENQAGIAIGKLTVADPDAGEAFTWSLSGGRFEVRNGWLALKAGVALDFEAAASQQGPRTTRRSPSPAASPSATIASTAATAAATRSTSPASSAPR